MAHSPAPGSFCECHTPSWWHSHVQGNQTGQDHRRGIRASASLTGSSGSAKPLTAHRETDQGAPRWVSSSSNCRFSCPKYKDQMDLSLSENRKPALPVDSDLKKQEQTPPFLSSFVPLPPCCFIVKKSPSFSLDGGKIQRPSVLGLSLNSQNQKPFRHSYKCFVLPSWAVIASRAPLFLLSNVLRVSEDRLSRQLATGVVL